MWCKKYYHGVKFPTRTPLWHVLIRLKQNVVFVWYLKSIVLWKLDNGLLKTLAPRDPEYNCFSGALVLYKMSDPSSIQESFIIVKIRLCDNFETRNKESSATILILKNVKIIVQPNSEPGLKVFATTLCAKFDKTAAMDLYTLVKMETKDVKVLDASPLSTQLELLYLRC